MNADTRLQVDHWSKRSKPSTSDPRLDVLKTRAVLHCHIRYVIKPADPRMRRKVRM